MATMQAGSNPLSLHRRSLLDYLVSLAHGVFPDRVFTSKRMSSSATSVADIYNLNAELWGSSGRNATDAEPRRAPIAQSSGPEAQAYITFYPVALILLRSSDNVVKPAYFG